MAGKNKDASLNKRAFTSGFFFILAQLFARGLTFAVTLFFFWFFLLVDNFCIRGLFQVFDTGAVWFSPYVRILVTDWIYGHVIMSLEKCGCSKE